ncbi:MAG: SGNH/GDSL hydrolase family protein [Lachnospiraceae bacterium]|nr:SGNH/GDSL hydrolase family protein [Lachnospiraceae bacterium]
MKEWLIRIICVLLGVILTLSTIHLKNLITDTEFFDTKAEINEQDSIDEKTAETDSNADYDLEAKLKYQDMVDKKATPAPTPEEPTPVAEKQEEKEDTTEEIIPPGSIRSAPVRWIEDYPSINSDTTIEDKLQVRSSYDETMAVNAFDKMVIDNSTIDFSKVKITVLGDSITAGSNLDDAEKEEYNWPKQLKDILGCKEVVNLGIGGSTVSCCVDHYPMCKRWSDIESDSDIIIVMGGSNDMLFEDKWQFGEIEYDKRMTVGTFCGDLDDMLSRMEWTYRDHNDDHYCKMLYINPPSTILNDAVYAVDPGNMVQQRSFAEAINTIAPAYSFEVIDMYNNNILNSHDPDVNAKYVYDGIHCNKEGYTIIAEHVASQIIQRIEQ